MIRNLAHEVYLGSLYTGELAETFAGPGQDGPGAGANDSLEPGVRYRIKVTELPATGTLVMDDVRGGGTFTPAQDGTEQATYQLEREGAVLGTAVMHFTTGAVQTPLQATEAAPLTFDVTLAGLVDFIADANVRSFTLVTGSQQAPVVPVITAQPVGGATVTVAADNAVGYQWFLDGAPVAGETGASFTPGAAGQAYCLVIGASGYAIKSATVATSAVAVRVTHQGDPVTHNGEEVFHGG